MSSTSFSVGSLVKCRGREWVVLPSDDKDVMLLRPLIGSDDETCGVFLPLGLDKIEAATFPPPTPDRAGDFESCKLLWNAARFNLRSGAGPFRCMGRLSVRPRPYQMVPLLMALRLDPVRLLIADDVGIGKTIEAALIARELLDRGEEKRLAVLCPPYLCDQWQAELKEKFHIDAVVIRSGTVGRLERLLPGGDVSVFDHYPHIIVSIDYAKMPRRRESFIQSCPRLVIVDEAHACSLPRGRQAGSPQHQRFELLRDLAKDPKRHLLLLTATPHSGIEESFRSLLGFIKPSFGDVASVDSLEGELLEEDVRKLSPHFLQRKRIDVADWLGEKSPFPKRIAEERTYTLSEPYKELFKDVYEFAREMVQAGEELRQHRKRVRYWAALSLLRCITSSPASGEAALQKKFEREVKDMVGGPDSDAAVVSGADFVGAGSDDSMDEVRELAYRGSVMDLSPEDEEVPDDISPSHIIEQAIEKPGLRKLAEFRKRAGSLAGDLDNKARAAADVVGELLKKGFHPIVYCRFIATADYVRDELSRRLRSGYSALRVISVTSTLTDDERRIRVDELAESPCRVLVATDCLSEGINLQDHFDAVVHYDLPWNPNRLEQREGRVDRFRQSRPEVRTVLIHGRDNPIDNAVLDILIKKAREIRKRLGISVPIPLSSESIMEAVLRALLFKGQVGQQLELFMGEKISLEGFYKLWDDEADKYENIRKRFAQSQIKPGEVMQALEETDAVLGDKDAVQSFVLSTCNRLGAVAKRKGYWDIDLAKLPAFVKQRLLEAYEYGSLSYELRPLRRRAAQDRFMKVCFDNPALDGAEIVGRNHPLTNALAEYVFESALAGAMEDDLHQDNVPGLVAARCGVIRTDAVEKRTTIVLLRVRYEIARSGHASSFAEECVVCGFEDASTGAPGAGLECSSLDWITEEKVLSLLDKSRPSANVSKDEKIIIIKDALGITGELGVEFAKIAEARAKKLVDGHNRVRRAAKSETAFVNVVLPVDFLGLYVLSPVAGDF